MRDDTGPNPSRADRLRNVAAVTDAPGRAPPVPRQGRGGGQRGGVSPGPCEKGTRTPVVPTLERHDGPDDLQRIDDGAEKAWGWSSLSPRDAGARATHRKDLPPLRGHSPAAGDAQREDRRLRGNADVLVSACTSGLDHAYHPSRRVGVGHAVLAHSRNCRASPGSGEGERAASPWPRPSRGTPRTRPADLPQGMPCPLTAAETVELTAPSG